MKWHAGCFGTRSTACCIIKKGVINLVLYTLFMFVAVLFTHSFIDFAVSRWAYRRFDLSTECSGTWPFILLRILAHYVMILVHGMTAKWKAKRDAKRKAKQRRRSSLPRAIVIHAPYRAIAKNPQ